MKKVLLIVCLLIQFAFAGDKDSSGVILLDIQNFENDEGKVQISLFNSEDGFPGEYKKAFKYTTQEINNKSALVALDSIPFGQYAIGILHDKNMDNELNTNWLGIPKEGVAASNNATGTFGPPDFEDALIDLKSDTLFQNIEIRNY